jgi:hypothetical protein
MAKASTKPKASAHKSVMATLPWTGSLFGGHAEIDGLNAISGKWETIATVYAIDGVDAEDLADFIINVMNQLVESTV